MSESGFETYLIMEHGKRWEIQNKIEKVERKLKHMLSGDNSARFSKYLTSHKRHLFVQSYEKR